MKNNQPTQKRSRVQGAAWSSPNDKQVRSTAKSTNPPKSTTGLAYKQTKTPKQISIQEGLVLMKSALDWQTQIWLMDMCFTLGKSTSTEKEGFYEEKEGRMVLNQGTRGRLIREMQVFPEEFRALCLRLLATAREVDPSLPDMDPNTVLINYYNEKASFKWHKDSEDPNLIKTKQGKPIISLSVGQSATFAYKRYYDDKEHQSIRLNSGDVLIFGGPSRMIVHSVQEIIGKSMPPPLVGKMRSGRLNLTVRDIGVGRVDREQFPAYRVVYDNDTENNAGEEAA